MTATEHYSMTTIVNIRHSPYDVYIGRPGMGMRADWGNPYSHLPHTTAQFKVATRDLAISSYEEYLSTRPDLIARLWELKDKRLGCFCAPLSCHGEILARYADISDLRDVTLQACYLLSLEKSPVAGVVYRPEVIKAMLHARGLKTLDVEKCP